MAKGSKILSFLTHARKGWNYITVNTMAANDLAL